MTERNYLGIVWMGIHRSEIDYLGIVWKGIHRIITEGIFKFASTSFLWWGLRFRGLSDGRHGRELTEGIPIGLGDDGDG